MFEKIYVFIIDANGSENIPTSTIFFVWAAAVLLLMLSGISIIEWIYG